MGVLAQIYELPVSKFRHSHHTVVGAAHVSCDSNQHFCGETGEDRDELHSEPHNQGRGLKFLDLRLDDYEGSVHHHVSHSRGDIRYLQKHKTWHGERVPYFGLFSMASVRSLSDTFT